MYSRMHEKVAGSPRGRLSFEGLKSKKELRRLIFALFQEDNEHSIFSKCFKINEDGKQNYSSPPGEGVQTGKVRTSPKIFCCGLFHHRNDSTFEISSSSILFFAHNSLSFQTLVQILFSNLIDHYPHFLNFSYSAKRLPDHYFL